MPLHTQFGQETGRKPHTKTRRGLKRGPALLLPPRAATAAAAAAPLRAAAVAVFSGDHTASDAAEI